MNGERTGCFQVATADCLAHVRSTLGQTIRFMARAAEKTLCLHFLVINHALHQDGKKNSVLKPHTSILPASYSVFIWCSVTVISQRPFGREEKQETAAASCLKSPGRR